jgi:hypothetical protein
MEEQELNITQVVYIQDKYVVLYIIVKCHIHKKLTTALIDLFTNNIWFLEATLRLHYFRNIFCNDRVSFFLYLAELWKSI